jgi:Rps23 Pro-64 3,4-dihydroxylase Tpa1-like proline 4-hydroxylase
MTSKQILDSFSETLLQDERILSAQERALVASLLQHAKSASAANPETRDAVLAVIASAVGETVAQRAFGVLGGNIVERILEDSALSIGEFNGLRTAELAKEPQSPGKPMKGPGPPSPSPDPESPGAIPKAPFAIPKAPATIPKEPVSPGKPMKGPAPPSPSDPESPGAIPKAPFAIPKAPASIPKEPQPPRAIPKAPATTFNDPESPGRGHATKVVANASVAVVERPEKLPSQCVVLDEFLAPQELEALTRFTFEREGEFETSQVVSPTEEHGIVNYEHRRSHVLMDLKEQQDIMLARIKAVLPQVLGQLGMEEFEIADVEAQITASNDGDYFHFHSDNASDQVRSRHLTFVYFFHREPRQFEGGELRIHDARLKDGVYVSEGSYQTIAPQQNQIVFFQCELMHEITPVKCPSQLFADSRFTLNGWLRQ